MGTKKDDISVKELFSRKLGMAEVVPSAAVNKKIMRRLARKEFVRFNPARFNAYYLGTLFIASVAAGLLLFAKGTDSLKSDTGKNIIESSKTSESKYLNIPLGSIVKRETEAASSTGVSKEKSGIKTVTGAASVNGSVNSDTKTRAIVNITPPTIENNINGTELLSINTTGNNKLKSGYHSGDMLFESSVSSGCIPLRVHFRNRVTSFDSCKWTFGDGGFSNKSNPDWIFDIEGDFKVTLDVFESDGTHKDYSTTISVYQKPQASFEISPEKAVLPDDEIRFMNYSTGAVRFNWDFGDGSGSDLSDPRHNYQRFGNYNVKLVAISENGCRDSLVVMNAFTGSEYFVTFPNAFIPNTNGPTGGYYSAKSDEGAQVFHPEFSGVTDYQLKIFSKIGLLIFESNDVNIGWDGYFKGQLSNPGVYIWKVRGHFRNGEPFTKVGDLTLLKN